jgi:UDP-2,4-diacetamido-2,4,6-trideoxy-beta-L-altropyranose hydrolase
MNRPMSSVAFRVDASAQIGVGHLMRCLTLADALKQRGARTRFLSRHVPKHLLSLLSAKGHEFVPIGAGSTSDQSTGDLLHSDWLGASQATDAQDTVRALSERTWDLLVVDHYALDIRWESALRASARRTLVIDDLADRTHDCDALLDQNFYTALESRYDGKVPSRCQLLLGPRYALLREEFGSLRPRIRPRAGQVKRVLVCFGGMDIENHTAHAVEALASLQRQELHVDVVIGAEHPGRAAIEWACAENGFTCHVQCHRMAELMAAADLAIGAAGSTSWERCSLGLPTLAVALAENQRRVLEDAALEGMLYAPHLRGSIKSLTLHLEALLENPRLLQMISRKAFEVVDGRGVHRVLRALGFGSIRIREATSSDSHQMFIWRNDERVRSVSRNKEPIDWAEHETWIDGVLADSNRLLLLGEQDGTPVGMVRFDIHAREAEVSIYLAPDYIGMNIGADLLVAAELWLAQRRPDVRTIEAHVLEDNRRSHRLFQTLGYQAHYIRYRKKAHLHE